MVKVTDQKRVFKSGNEGAAWAAKQIDFDVMGYYPIKLSLSNESWNSKVRI